MALSALEERAVAIVADRREAIVDVAADLVRLDTTARDLGDAPRDEAALQGLLAERLAPRRRRARSLCSGIVVAALRFCGTASGA